MNEAIQLNYFITGASGYLGSNILRKLVDQSATIYCLRRTTSNLSRLNGIEDKVIWVDANSLDYRLFFQEHKVDCILHCATDYGRKQKSPLETIDANLILPLNLLDAGIRGGVRYFVNTDTVLDKNINSYSLSKKHFLDWLRFYSNEITVLNVALEHFYGPADDPSKFVTSIIRSMIDGIEKIDLTLGNQKRDFIFIDDVVNAFLILFESLNTFEIGLHSFEVGSGQSIKIKCFVELAKKLSGNKNTFLNFGAIPYRKNEVMSSDVNIKELNKLGWKPLVSLNDGLLHTITNEKKR